MRPAGAQCMPFQLHRDPTFRRRLHRLAVVLRFFRFARSERRACCSYANSDNPSQNAASSIHHTIASCQCTQLVAAFDSSPAGARFSIPVQSCQYTGVLTYSRIPTAGPQAFRTYRPRVGVSESICRVPCSDLQHESGGSTRRSRISTAT